MSDCFEMSEMTTHSVFFAFSWSHLISDSIVTVVRETACAAPKRMAAPRRLVFFFCGRGKVGRGNNRILQDESFEPCSTEQRCSGHCVLLFIFFLIVRPLGSQREGYH